MRLRRLCQYLGAILIAAAVFSPTVALGETGVQNQLCKGANITGCNTGSEAQPLRNSIGTITQTLLVVAGAVAVIIIILSGIRYITSTGDATRVQQAKDTLLYAVIGLGVVIAAYAIVHAIATRIT